MALFSRKKEVKEAVATVSTAPKALGTDRNLVAVIVRPHLTEKAMVKGEQNVFTFEVRRDATKFQVRDAIVALYKVTPMKVNIVNKKPALRLKGSQNRMVKVPGVKKAYVYLKKGDTINLV